MAVRDDANRRATLLCSLMFVVAFPVLAGADAPFTPYAPPPALDAASSAATRPEPETGERWRTLWRTVGARVRSASPEWLHQRSGKAPTEPAVSAGPGAWCVVVQEDRPDGTDLLTARYTLHDRGALRTYAGAGLNRAKYFHDESDDPGPTTFTRRNRHTSMGAAAELGAELQVSERMLVNAGMRWADLNDDAEALGAQHGPVVADPLVVGVSVGYRFR